MIGDPTKSPEELRKRVEARYAKQASKDAKSNADEYFRMLDERNALRADLQREREKYEIMAASWRQQKERRELLEMDKEVRLNMLCDRLGGLVEGRPTAHINYLQRVDELREIERERDTAQRELGRAREALQKIRDWAGSFSRGWRDQIRETVDGALSGRAEGSQSTVTREDWETLPKKSDLPPEIQARMDADRAAAEAGDSPTPPVATSGRDSDQCWNCGVAASACGRVGVGCVRPECCARCDHAPRLTPVATSGGGERGPISIPPIIEEMRQALGATHVHHAHFGDGCGFAVEQPTTPTPSEGAPIAVQARTAGTQELAGIPELVGTAADLYDEPRGGVPMRWAGPDDDRGDMTEAQMIELGMDPREGAGEVERLIERMIADPGFRLHGVFDEAIATLRVQAARLNATQSAPARLTVEQEVPLWNAIDEWARGSMNQKMNAVVTIKGLIEGWLNATQSAPASEPSEVERLADALYRAHREGEGIYTTDYAVALTALFDAIDRREALRAARAGK